MGESPKEEAARSQRDDLARIQERLISGDLSGEAQFGKIDPLLQLAFSTQLGGLTQNIGESLVGSGVARGHDMGGAFLSAVSPAIAEFQKTRAMTFSDLLQSAIKNMLFAQGLESGALGQMKSSTTFGDIMAGLQSYANIVKSIAGLPGISGPSGGGAGSNG